MSAAFSCSKLSAGNRWPGVAGTRPRAIGLKIDRRVVGHDGLDAIAFAHERLVGGRVAVVRRRGENHRQMSAGAAAVHAEAVGIDAPLLGVVADEAHRAAHVGDRVRHQIPRAAAVAHDDDGESLVEQKLKARDGLGGRRPARDPAAADHVQNRRAVGAGLRLEDVERHRQSVLVAVDQVGEDLHFDGSGRTDEEAGKHEGRGSRPHGPPNAVETWIGGHSFPPGHQLSVRAAASRYPTLGIE